MRGLADGAVTVGVDPPENMTRVPLTYTTPGSTKSFIVWPVHDPPVTVVATVNEERGA